MREFYPFLVKIEKDINDPMFYSMPDYTWCGKNRQAEIDARIGSLENTIASLSADTLNAYAESLKFHLRQAMAYRKEGPQWSNEQNILVDSHRQLSFSIFALILREYDSKKIAFNTKVYASTANIEDFDAFFSEVCRAAEDGGIFHNPTIAQLLSASVEQPRLKEFDAGLTPTVTKDNMAIGGKSKKDFDYYVEDGLDATFVRNSIKDELADRRGGVKGGVEAAKVYLDYDGDSIREMPLRLFFDTFKLSGTYRGFTKEVRKLKKKSNTAG